ncbi:MAG: GNAT family N-acetyltransferase [Bacteroidales bacterium]|nr:GNAT family N-acetyltransferase [Bacteroidales bacterium]
MITIRPGTPTDIETIAGFQIAMALETENLQLDEPTVLAGVRNVFHKPELGKYFVAEKNKEVVASLLITYEWSDWRNGTFYWIQSVYVKPEHRGRGVFKVMYLHIKEMVLTDDKVFGIRLYVDKSNHRARQVYEKLQMNGDHYDLYEWMK